MLADSAIDIVAINTLLCSAHHGRECRSLAVNKLRLDLRFFAAILNRQVKVIGFCDFWLLLNLLMDDVPNFCDLWLSVRQLVDS